MIEYTDWNNEESLMDKIEENKVLDLNKQKKKTKKESLKTPTINIGEQHINIASNNKINSDNTIKINSDNTFYAKLSDNQKKNVHFRNHNNFCNDRNCRLSKL